MGLEKINRLSTFQRKKKIFPYLQLLTSQAARPIKLQYFVTNLVTKFDLKDIFVAVSASDHLAPQAKPVEQKILGNSRLTRCT